MSGTALKYNLAGIDALQQRIERLTALDRRYLLSLIGDTVVSQTQLRFIDGVAPDGTVWEESERVKQKGGQTLINNSILRSSITPFVYLSSEEVEIGSNLVYAAIHQFGGAAVGMPYIPARPYLGLSPDNKAELEATIDNWLEREVHA